MKNDNIKPTADNEQGSKSSCNVNSTFNFVVGAISIAVAGLIGYLVYVNFLN